MTFRDTGIPRGAKVEITKAHSNVNGSNSQGFPGKKIFITAIINSTENDSYVSVAGSQIKTPANSTNSYPIPLGPYQSFFISNGSHYPTDGLAVFYILVDEE